VHLDDGTNRRMKKPTQVQIDDSVRLRKLFKERSDMSQLEFGQAYEIGNQGMVWQYLNADKPKGSALNVLAAIKFATGLHCRVADFSPSIQAEIDKIAAFATAHAQGASLKIPQGLAEATYTAIEMLLLPTAERVSLSIEEQAAVAFMESTAAKRTKTPKSQHTTSRLSYG